MRRPSTPLVASIAVHLVVVVFFVQALVMRRPLFDIFNRNRSEPIGPVERIGFLSLPHDDHQPATSGRRGGNGRITSAAPSRQLVAPPSLPSTLPPVSNHSAPAEDNDPATGPMIGGGGQLRGIQPRYHDPRLWGLPGSVATAPKTAVQQLDSVISSDIAKHNDSVRIASGGRKPGDWTIERGGQKYGIDSKYIRLGPVSIPTAVLALLPLNITNNPTMSQRERSYTAMHDDIATHAQQQLNDADFQKAVREIRQRKERERAEREKQKATANSSAASSTTSGQVPPAAP